MKAIEKRRLGAAESKRRREPPCEIETESDEPAEKRKNWKESKRTGVAGSPYFHLRFPSPRLQQVTLVYCEAQSSLKESATVAVNCKVPFRFFFLPVVLLAN